MKKEIIRELGESLGFSIGTAIPLEENLFKEKPEITHLWINVRTLIRNYLDSIDDINKYPITLIVADFISEVEDLVPFLAHQEIEVVYYLTRTVTQTSPTFKRSSVKTPKTDKQKRYANTEDSLLKAIDSHEINVATFGHRLKYGRNDLVHIMTSYPIDLLSHYEFGKLKLLESHTGKIKERTEWIGKLNKDPKYSHLPFNVLTLFVLGDRSNNFFSMKPSIKKELLQISTEGNWNPMTSSSKMNSDITKYGGENKQLLLNILNTTIN